MSATADGLTALLADPATPDEAIARAAAAGAGDELAQLLEHEDRLLRHPAIVASLFANRLAPMEVVNLAVAACARAGVKVEGIPAFDDVAAAVKAEVDAGGAGAAGAAVTAFDETYAETEIAHADGDGDEDGDEDEDEDEDEDGKEGAVGERGMGE